MKKSKLLFFLKPFFISLPTHNTSSSHKEMFNGLHKHRADWLTAANYQCLSVPYWSAGKISIFSLARCPAGHVTCSDPAMDTNGTYISWSAPNVTCHAGTQRMRGREQFGVNTHSSKYFHQDKQSQSVEMSLVIKWQLCHLTGLHLLLLKALICLVAGTNFQGWHR